MLRKITFRRFTAFENLALKFSPGVNIFVGENGTGKTHILKAAYAACEVTKSAKNFAEKINDVFYPFNKQPGRLVKRAPGRRKGSVELIRQVENEDGTPTSAKISLEVSNLCLKPEDARVADDNWTKHKIESAFIPVKDMMANAPGFQALYAEREIHFEEVYVDILRKAQLPALRGPADGKRKPLRDILAQAINGRVEMRGEEFFLRNDQGDLEFTLLAEGFRKLGLLSTLIRNGTLLDGSVLFWDEPETNLNPKLMKIVVEILLALQRLNVQVFLSTHDYAVLKEFDLQSDPKKDRIVFHSLFRRSEDGEIAAASGTDYLDVHPNPIDEAFTGFISRDIERSMGAIRK